MRLKSNFYKKDAVTLAKDLLGKLLVRKIGDREIVCRIVETEAYVGPEDKGCHAFNNKRTKRTEIIFHEGGVAYVYSIYGMHYCFNIVASKKDKPEAVFIRAVEPLKGLDLIKENRQIKCKKVQELTNGPGKLAQALNINKDFNGYDLVNGDSIYLMDDKGLGPLEIIHAKRVNIDYAEEYKDKLWRFYIRNSIFISKK